MIIMVIILLQIRVNYFTDFLKDVLSGKISVVRKNGRNIASNEIFDEIFHFIMKCIGFSGFFLNIILKTQFLA